MPRATLHSPVPLLLCKPFPLYFFFSSSAAILHPFPTLFPRNHPTTTPPFPTCPNSSPFPLLPLNLLRLAPLLSLSNFRFSASAELSRAPARLPPLFSLWGLGPTLLSFVRSAKVSSPVLSSCHFFFPFLPAPSAQLLINSSPPRLFLEVRTFSAHPFNIIFPRPFPGPLSKGSVPDWRCFSLFLHFLSHKRKSSISME